MLEVFRCIIACNILFLRLPVTCSLYINFFSHLFSIFYENIPKGVIFLIHYFVVAENCLVTFGAISNTDFAFKQRGEC